MTPLKKKKNRSTMFQEMAVHQKSVWATQVRLDGLKKRRSWVRRLDLKRVGVGGVIVIKIHCIKFLKN